MPRPEGSYPLFIAAGGAVHSADDPALRTRIVGTNGTIPDAARRLPTRRAPMIPRVLLSAPPRRGVLPAARLPFRWPRARRPAHGIRDQGHRELLAGPLDLMAGAPAHGHADQVAGAGTDHAIGRSADRSAPCVRGGFSNADIDGSDLITGGPAPAGPFDQTGWSSPQPVGGSRECMAVAEGHGEVPRMVAPRVELGQAGPGRGVDPHRAGPGVEHRAQVGVAQGAQGGPRLGDQGALTGHQGRRRSGPG